MATRPWCLCGNNEKAPYIRRFAVNGYPSIEKAMREQGYISRVWNDVEEPSLGKFKDAARWLDQGTSDVCYVCCISILNIAL